MPISGFSITDGDRIFANNANYETYKEKLPVCGTCFGEICLVKGERKTPYWRHFPGVGIDCPDKSEVKNIACLPNNRINRKQSLALFKQRFLEILDFGIQPKVEDKTGIRNLSFTTDEIVNTASVIDIQCSDAKVNFDSVMLNICNRHRRHTEIITALTDVAVNQLYNKKFVDWDIDYHLKKQVAQITTQYLEIQRSTAQLATSYVFTKGRENILTKLMAYSWLIQTNKQINSSKTELPIYLMVDSIALLSSIHWFNIINALLDKRKPQIIPTNTKFDLSPEGIEILALQFNSPLPKRKPKGFKRK